MVCWDPSLESDDAMSQPLPLQPLEKDAQGVLRFRANALVLHLIEHGSIDLDQLAQVNAPQEDLAQFEQLIGRSLSGFGELSYVSNETYARDQAMADDLDNPPDPRDAHIQALEEELATRRRVMHHIATCAECPSHALLPDSED